MRMKFVFVLVTICLMCVSINAQNIEQDNKPRRVAVMEFVNRTGCDEWNQACKTVSRLLINDLCSTPGVLVMERDRLIDAIREIELGEDGYLDPKTAPKARKTIDAEFIVEGELAKKEKALVFKFSLFSLEENRRIYKGNVQGAQTDLYKLEAEILKKLLKSINPKKIKAVPHKVPHHIKLGIMPFEDISPEGRMGALCGVLRDMLEADLSNIPQISMLTREFLSEILKEQSLSLSDLVDRKNAIKVCKFAGIEYMVLGTVTLVGEVLRLDARVVETESGLMVLTAGGSGTVKEYDKMSGELSDKILTGLRVKVLQEERNRLKRTRLGAREVLYYFNQAAENAMVTRSIVGPEEKQAVQRILYLDALDTGAELYLIDKLIDIKMYKEAGRRIRRNLLKKNPNSMQAALWLRLAKTYQPSGQIPILWHIAKTFPGTDEELEAYWLLAHTYDYGEYALAKMCLEKLVKRTNDLSRIEKRVSRDISSPPMSFENYASWKLMRVNERIWNNEKNLKSADADNIYKSLTNRLREAGVEFDARAVEADVEKYCAAVRAGEYIKALTEIKKFPHLHLTDDHVYKQCQHLTEKLAIIHEFDKALRFVKWQIEIFNTSGISTRCTLAELEKIANNLEIRKKYWKAGAPEKYSIPDYDSDRGFDSFLNKKGNKFYKKWHERCAAEAFEKYPEDPAKALDYATNLAKKARVIKSRIFGKQPTRRDGIRLQASVLIEICEEKGKQDFALEILNKHVPGDTVEAKVKRLSESACAYFGDYYIRRLDFGKAMAFYQKGDLPSMLDILMFKLRDYKTAIQYIPKVTGGFVSTPKNLPVFGQRGGRANGRFQRNKKGYLWFLYARCKEELGEFELAHSMYYRYINGPGAFWGADQAIVSQANTRMAALEKRLIPVTAKKIGWKVGDWWEGVQAWYVSSPNDKTLQNGWIFSDMYFEISEFEKINRAENYVLKIYNCSRAAFLKVASRAPENNQKARANFTDKLLFATCYFHRATLAPSAVLYGPGCKLPTGRGLNISDNTRPNILKRVMLDLDHTLVPLAENRFLPPAASIILAKPFRPVSPEWLAKKVVYSSGKIGIFGADQLCETADLKLPVDLNLMAYTSKGVSFKKPLEILTKKYPAWPYHGKQWWCKGYPWWVRVVEHNRWYEEGNSPAYAKYSKLFVMTNHNGKEIRVDTGLPGKMTDINKMREHFASFEKDFPYINWPSKEVEPLINIFCNFKFEYISPYKYASLKRRSKAVIPYLRELFKKQISTQKNFEQIVNILNELGDNYFIENVDSFLDRSDFDDRETRFKYLKLLKLYDNDKRFEILERHLNRCRDKKHTKLETEHTLLHLIETGTYKVIPILLDYYRESEDIYYLNKAINVSKRSFKFRKTYVRWDTPKKKIEEYVKEAEQWYKSQLENNK